MRRGMFLMVLLALFLLPTMNPSLSSIPAAIGNELNEKPFFAAADGAESSESITSFSETSADDTLHYPDTGPWSTTDDNADSYAVYGEVSTTTGTIADTYDDDANHHQTTKTYSGAFGMDYTIDAGGIRNVESPILSVDAGFSCDLGFPGVVVRYYIYNYDTSAFVQFWSYTGSGVFSGVLCDREDAITHEYISNSTDQITIRFYHASASASTSIIDVYYIALLYTDNYEGYAESFADVSDWTTSDTSISTDGDVATITENGAGSTGRAYASFSSTDFFEYYYEFRIESMTATTSNLEFWDGAAYNTLKTFTAAGTYKGIISDADAATMQRIGFLVGSEGGNVKPDYLRIGPADEMGWQHDGSTVAGVTVHNGATVSSDGDYLSCVSDDSAQVRFHIDTTTTNAYADPDYYQFLEIAFHPDDSADLFAIELYDGAPRSTGGYYAVGTTPHVFNIEPITPNDVRYFILYLLYAQTVRVKYIKLYSIANSTITQSGTTYDDYLYVDSGVLYSNIDDGYIELNRDPALSVSDTYSIWNLTTGSTAPQFSDYVSSWSSYSSETRGALQSGTVTDVKLKFTADGDISAIKFIEDGTAPDIIDKFIGPPEPDDSEAVTITAVTYDAIEVYEVTINAVVYPAGFSDVDYDLTEQIDDVLWSYEFSTLTAGYYLFQVTANDGANTYSEYIPIIVRVSAIEISTYTFFGASSDFTYMQYSGHISHDCTYNISEWSTTWAKNETHTGSVTEGMFNIAWDKIGVDDAEANFTIVFVSGTLSLTIEGYYGTAYKALQVTEIDFVNLEQSDSWTTNLTINFYTNKEVDWTVYDRDDDDAVLHSGTTTEGDGFMTWVQNTARGAHHFAVKWTDGISDQWYNNSYWVFDRNIDDLPGGADPGADQRRTIEFWATIGGIAGILGIMVIGLSHYNMDEKIKNLPNYRTQGRDRR